MEYQIIEDRIAPDNSHHLKINLAQCDLVLFGFIFESLEGWCSFTTIKKGKISTLAVDIAPDYYEATFEVLDFITRWE